MKNILKTTYPYITAIVIFIIISVVYFSPQLKGYIIKQYDIERYIGMSKEIKDYREKFNDEPLWTNSPFGGMPAYQISLKNSNIIKRAEGVILKILPRSIGNMFLLMAGFFILLLCFNINPWLAIIGSIAYGLASFNVIYLANGHIAKVHAISFIPPLVGGIIYAYRKNLYIGAIITSIFTCLHLSANHLQITYYLIFLLFAIVIVELYRFSKEKAILKFLKISGILIIAGALGVLPTMSNLIVTNEYSKHTTRGKSELTISSDKQQTENNEALDIEYIKRYNLGKGEIWSLVIPNVKGGEMGVLGQKKEIMKTVDSRYRQNVAQFYSYWGEQAGSGGAFYYGACVFLLFILGMFFIKDKIKWAFFSVCILAILLSFKNGNIVDFFIYKFPLFNKFRDSKMMLVLVQLSFPLISILFLKHFINNEVDRKKFIYVTLGVSGLFLLFYLMPTVWFDFLSKTEMQYFNEQISKIGNNTNYLRQLDDFQNEIIDARILIFKKDCLRSLFFILVTAALLFLYIYGKIKEIALLSLLGLFVLIDMWGIDKRYLNNEKRGSQYLYWVDSYRYKNPFQPTVADMDILNNELKENPGLNQIINTEVEKLNNKKGLKTTELNLEKAKIYFRELNFATDYRVFSLQNRFADSRNAYFHKSLSGYHGAKLRRINELIDFHLSKEDAQLSYFIKNYPDKPINDVLKLSAPVLCMLNTKYIMYDLNKAPIINPYRFGNAWFVRKINFVENADEEILALDSINKSIAVVQNQFREKINSNIQFDSSGVIKLKQYRPNHLTYETSTQKEQFAVFSEIYYEDGWNAYIDGEKSDYIKANFLLRAMNIPEGDHIVEFKFEPTSYFLSRKISVAGSGLIILFIIGALFLNWKNNQKMIQNE